MQSQSQSPSPNKDSTTNKHPSPSLPPPLPHNPETERESEPISENPSQETAAPTAEPGSATDKGSRLFKRTLRIPKHLLKPTTGVDGEGGSPAPADVAEGLVDVLVKEVTSFGPGEGGSAAAALVAEAATGNMVSDSVRSSSCSPKKAKLQVKRKPTTEASANSSKPLTCRLCFQKFPTWKTLYHHLQTHHPTAQVVHDQPPQDHRGAVAGDNIEEKKKGEEGSSGATGGHGFDLNQPMELGVEISRSSETKNQVVEEASATPHINENDGDDHIHAHKKKKFRFDLNELPPADEDDAEKKP